MAEPNQPEFPGIPVEPNLAWNPGVAFKKVAWGTSKLLAAKAMAIPVLGPFLGAFNELGASLQPYGLYFHADATLLAQGLQIALFMGLVAIHDVARLKTGYKWL
jgi:hypothetical protein